MLRSFVQIGVGAWYFCNLELNLNLRHRKASTEVLKTFANFLALHSKFSLRLWLNHEDGDAISEVILCALGLLNNNIKGTGHILKAFENQMSFPRTLARDMRPVLFSRVTLGRHVARKESPSEITTKQHFHLLHMIPPCLFNITSLAVSGAY
jgi:hypothetical protein